MLSFVAVQCGTGCRRRFGTIALALLLVGAVHGLAAGNKSGKAKRAQAADDLFATSQVYRIQIQIAETDLPKLRGYRWGWGGPREGAEDKRPTVRGTVREGGHIYTNVAIHLKGAAGSFQGIDEDPSLTLNFDKYVKGQTFHGLQRFSLNNSVQDRSLLNEQISREMFAKAGIAVPRAGHAKVELNGRDLGVHVLVEAANKQFLARHFKSSDGNLYDGGFLRDVDDQLERSSGTGPNDRADLARLARAAREPDYTNRLQQLSKVLDLDQFITYLALDMIMCDWDGYGLNKNNYRVYHDPVPDKIYFIPHGLDQMFGVMRTGTDMPVAPRHMNGLVAQAVLQIPECRQRYRESLAQLMNTVYNVEALTNRISQIAAQVRPVLAEKGPAAVRSYDQQVSAFVRRIVARAKNVREQLATPDQTLKFDAAGMARFNDWRARADFGKPIIDETTEGGRRLLHVSARNGSAVGVWFTKVRLAPGRYRLEGKMKIEAVTPDPGDRKGGAGLQTSTQRSLKKLTGTTGWTDVAFDFETQEMQQGDFGFMTPIQDESPEIELTCELRAAKGDAWFDRGSLRLVRR